MLPAAVSTALADVNTAFQAATPLESAPPLVFASLRAKADALVGILDAQVVSTGSPLDGFTASATIASVPGQLLALGQANDDESALVDLRGLVGRIRANIALSQG